MPFDSVLQLALIGISQGCGYALVAFGFIFIYRASEIVNLAHGDLMMLGAFAVFTGAQLLGMNFYLAALLGIILLGVIGLLLGRVVMQRLTGESHASKLILTIAIAIVLKAAAGMLWGWETHSLDTPFNDTLTVGGIGLDANRVALIAGTAIVCLVLYLFFNRSLVGIAVQAVAQNQLAASYCGISVKRLNSLVWFIAAMLAAFAGIMMAPFTQIDPEMGVFGIKALAGAIVGGFASIPGALLGCLLIGTAEPFLDYAFPAFKGVFAYVIMLAVLLVRPEGLVAKPERKRV